MYFSSQVNLATTTHDIAKQTVVETYKRTLKSWGAFVKIVVLDKTAAPLSPGSNIVPKTNGAKKLHKRVVDDVSSFMCRMSELC